MKRRVPRAMKMTGDRAFVTHTYSNEYAVNCSGGAVCLYRFSLTNSARAMAVARGFQEYRINKVDVIFKPNSDTFTADSIAAGTGRGIPYLYYMIDKAGTFNNSQAGIQALKNAGAKPHRFDEKAITVTWKPSVQVVNTDAGSGPAPVVDTSSSYKISPWITTALTGNNITSIWSPNSVDHLGLTYACDTPSAAGTPYQVGVAQCRVHYEFRKPFWASVPPLVEPEFPIQDVDEEVQVVAPL